MCGDQRGLGMHFPRAVGKSHSARTHSFENGRVVNQFTQDGDRFNFSRLFGSGNRVPHPEAHTHIFCQ